MADNYKTDQILVGAAKVYVSVKDSTDSTFGAGPAVPAGTTGQTIVPLLDADTTNWRHLGFTTGGVEFNYMPDYAEVEVDQMLDAAKMFKQRQSASVATTLSQATLQNLLLAWGQSATTFSGDGETDELGISSGELGDEPVERSLVFVGQAPRSATNKKRERVYLVRRALQVESSAFTLNRSEASGIPVSFRLLPNPAYSNKQYGFVRDRAIST
jgi:hypothetical protein